MNRVKHGVLATVLGIALPDPAAAQTARVEASAGYEVARLAGHTLPVGWSADIAVQLNEAWAAVGEFSGAYRTLDHADLGTGVGLSLYTVAGGGRWSVRVGRRIAPFAQMLAGAARIQVSAETRGNEIGGSSTRLLLQPGGGVNVMLTDVLGVVWQADYRRTFVDDEDESDSGEHQFRILVGVRLRF